MCVCDFTALSTHDQMTSWHDVVLLFPCRPTVQYLPAPPSASWSSLLVVLSGKQTSAFPHMYVCVCVCVCVCVHMLKPQKNSSPWLAALVYEPIKSPPPCPDTPNTVYRWLGGFKKKNSKQRAADFFLKKKHPDNIQLWDLHSRIPTGIHKQAKHVRARTRTRTRTRY